MKSWSIPGAVLACLLCVPPFTSAEKRPSEPRSPRASAPEGMFAVEMKDGTRFTGKPLNTESVPVVADFGKVSLPLKLITGFEPVKGSNAVRIHFKNGDTLTGRIAIGNLDMQTRYGTVSVPLAEVARVWAGSRFDKTTVSAGVPKNVLPDPGRLTAFRAQVGKTLCFRVTGALGGSLWGTNIYTADSTLATAAVHAGVLKPGQTGIVKVTLLAGVAAHVGSTQNGVTSSGYGPYPFSYQVAPLKRAAQR